jgi:uncharacterized protein (TIGR00730 family)
MSAVRTVTIFGSSLPGEHSPSYAEARRLGRLLGEAGFAICNGGYSGLMEASARGGREAGCHTVGITCGLWPQTANPWILEQVPTSSFPERIMTLIQRGDAYIVLPGGTGTLAELALAWELMNKAVLAETLGGRKPLLVSVPYWQAVIDCLNQEIQLAAPHSTWRPPGLECVIPVASAKNAAERLREWAGR